MKSSHFVVIAALAVLAATPAMALEVKKSVTVKATPEAAWAAIGDFCGIGAWHPAIAKCELWAKDGATYRTLSLNGGGSIVEKQLARSNTKKSYSYSIEESPLPVDHYKSTIAVRSGDKGTTIVWSGKFDAKGAPDDKVKEIVTGIYQAGLKSLAGKLAK